MGDKHGDKDACDLIILSDTANIYGWIAMKSCLMRDVVTEGGRVSTTAPRTSSTES